MTGTVISVRRGNFGDSAIDVILHVLFFNAYARSCFISTSGLKSDVTSHHAFLNPDFLQDAGIPAIHEHLRQKLAYLCLHRFS